MHHVHESPCKKMVRKLSLLGICFGSSYAKIDLKNLKQGKAVFVHGDVGKSLSAGGWS